MSKLSRKARTRERKVKDNGKKVLLWVGIGLGVLAVIFGIIFS